MARENHVTLIGRTTKPTISLIEEFGTYKLTFKMTVMRKNDRVDHPNVVVYGLSEDKARAAWEQMKDGSIVIVNGLVSTRIKEKTCICPKCGTAKTFNVLITEVLGYDIPVVLSGETDIEKFKDISNQVFLLGKVASDLPSLITPTKTIFQFRIPRQTLIKEQGEIMQDIPWARTLGPAARDVYDRTHKNSELYIYGAIQTRIVDKTIPCVNSECDGEIKYSDNVAEVITTSVEYLNDCYFSDEEIALAREQRAAAKAKKG